MTLPEFTAKMREAFPNAKWWLWGNVHVYRTPAYAWSEFGLEMFRRREEERCETEIEYQLSLIWDFFKKKSPLFASYDVELKARSLDELLTRVHQERHVGSEQTALEWSDGHEVHAGVG